MRKLLLLITSILCFEMAFGQDSVSSVRVPKELIVSMCSDDPRDGSGAVTYDNRCVDILSGCNGILECVCTIDGELAKKIAKKAPPMSEDLLKLLIDIISDGKLVITKIKPGQVELKIVDKSNQVIYTRTLAGIGNGIYFSPIIKNKKRFKDKYLQKYQGQQDLFRKLKAVASVLDRFSFTISPNITAIK
ncbi:MAG TPA: hypothetical protein VGO09_06980 [Flavisolibacter sp.]|nr:hypothetical protein [Flavisolibacter sp.]